MSKVDGDLIQSILWYAIAAIWALIAIVRWLSGEYEGSDAMDPLRHRLHLGEHLRASIGDG